MIIPKRKSRRRLSRANQRLSELSEQLRPIGMPAAPSPMLCTLVAEPFDDPAWIFEPKYDGLRVLGRFDGRELTLLSRNQASQNLQFPDVVAAFLRSYERGDLVPIPLPVPFEEPEEMALQEAL